MDRNMRESLDRHIMGLDIHHQELVPHRCPKCNKKREIGMMYELGGWFYYPIEQEDLATCEDCQVDMVTIE